MMRGGFNVYSLIRAAIITASALIFISTNESARPSGIELKNLELIEVVGLDYSEASGEYTLSYLHESSSKSSGAGSEEGGTGGGEIEVISRTAASYNEAIRAARALSEKYISEGHIKRVIIGEEAARHGLITAYDFLLRHNSFRMNAKLFVAKNAAARDILEVVSSEVQLANIAHTINLSAKLLEADIISSLYLVNEPRPSGTLPALELAGDSEHNLKFAGLACIDGAALRGYADVNHTEMADMLNARELELVLNIDGNLLLKLQKSKVSYDITCENGVPVSVRVKCLLDASVEEIQNPDFAADEVSLLAAEKKAEGILTARLEKLFAHSKELETDFARIYRAIKKSHPDCWREVHGNWNAVFAELELSATVELNISGSYNISALSAGRKN